LIVVPFIWNLILAIFDASKVAGTLTEVAPAATLATLPSGWSATSANSTAMPAGMLPLAKVQLTPVIFAPALHWLKVLAAVVESPPAVIRFFICGHVEVSTPWTSHRLKPKPAPGVAPVQLPPLKQRGAPPPLGLVRVWQAAVVHE
jgi:hypothetical protein